jgi:hypothetical protein
VTISRFYLTAGDVGPPLDEQLVDQNGTPINLTGATVTFRMVEYFQKTFVAVNSLSAMILDAINGKVRYQWTTGDTATPGLYLAWFVVNWGGGPQHFPQDDSLIIKIDTYK